jgi:hypothetical protein
MLGMLKEEKWTGEVALFLITVSLIVRNSEGHSYQSEDTTGNSEHMLKWSTESISSADIRSVRTYSLVAHAESCFLC